MRLSGNAIVWAGRKADDAPAVATARGAALAEAGDEYRRLLYVAMTRAADRLIVCGADGERKRPDGCWYDLISRAFEPHLVEEADGEQKVWRFRKTPAIAARTAATEVARSAAAPEFPAWLRQKAPLRAPRSMPLSPSAAFAEDIGRAIPAAAHDRQKALQRGQIVHRLMQSLPDIAAPARQSALESYLGSAAMKLSAAEQADIARQVLGILDDSSFAAVFAPGSRPEVPIVGRIARHDPVLVAGQVDRLIITADCVFAVDYKTDSAVPARLEDVPAEYIAQLALYRAVLTRIYPAKRVRAALLFSAGPRLIEVPGTVMDTVLQAQLDAAPSRGCHAPVSAA
jgi:ATP-dependent helicase/nuclease subunit A